MKGYIILKTYSPVNRDRAQRGVALVLVLIGLVLVAGLLVSLMNVVKAGRTDSAAYADGQNVRVLADNAINVVIGQIKDATSDTTQSITWASQPGAIRTYDTSGFNSGYKLYSSGMMVTTTETDFTDGINVDWATMPGKYVNLNQPITKSGSAGTVYPIADPAVLTTSGTVEGFSVTSLSQSYQSNLEMPVEWLYQLEDGTLAAGVYQPATGATIVAAASSTNQIVGRIAFWTDDETAKVNVNTASEGLYWDTPRVNTQVKSGQTPPICSDFQVSGTDPFNAVGTDQGYAAVQPAANEFNRFPGHPAMTSLSSVFPELSGTQILALVPRIAYGGSKLGTVSWLQGGTVYSPASTSSVVTLDSDRLYATTGETMLTGTRALNAGITPQMVDQRKFVLTSCSRAPELNVFGRPRVSMWPVSSGTGTANRTAFDSLSVFCSTLTGSSNSWPFLFLRGNAYSATDDYSTIASNQLLYTYLKDVTNKPTPGYGGTLQGKYGTDCNQILTEMLDYIRCTNCFDSSIEPSGYSYGTSTGNEFTSGVQKLTLAGNYANVTIGKPGHAQVIPLQIGSTMGIGRTVTVSQVALHLISTADALEGGRLPADTDPFSGTNPPSNVISGTYVFNNVLTSTSAYAYGTNNTLNGVRLSGSQRRIQAMLLVELATPMEGFPDMTPSVRIEITGAQDLKPNNVALFPSSGSLYTYKSSDYSSGETDPAWWYPKSTGGAGASGYLGFYPLALTAAYVKKSTDSLPSDTVWGTNPRLCANSFISAPFTVDAATTSSLTIPSANLTLKLYFAKIDSNHGDGATPYQTIHINTPSWTVPIPTLVTADNPKTRAWSFTQGGCGVATIVSGSSYSGHGRLSWSSTGNPNGITPYFSYMKNWIRAGDVVRAMQVVDGDFRLNAAMNDVPSTRFASVGGNPPPASTALAHSLSYPVNPYFASPTSTNQNQYLWPMDTALGRSVGAYALYGGSPVTYNGNGPEVPSSSDYPSGVTKPSDTGDWDNGIGAMADGPFANMPDGGNIFISGATNYPPYFWGSGYEGFSVHLGFSPNRQIPSPGMFGSLPTGVMRGKPWETLRFRPHDSSSTDPNYNVSAPDHLFMDLFWMPVVQPYAISDVFSTAGKINLNYQIVPFTYIKRQTGLYAVLKAERMLAVPSNAGPTYKGGSSGAGEAQTTGSNWRHPINIPETLSQFDTKFAQGKIFRTASEICEQHLVPVDPNDATAAVATMATYWTNHSLTGDNSKERPYTDIYSRLTTQSNTYRVHYWVQSIKKVNKTTPTVFVDPSPSNKATLRRDVIGGQLRGSTVIERYIQPNDPRLGNSIKPMTDSLNSAYKIRILSSETFSQ
ncbi:MAG: Verru_Chthon cassette protein A [Chthoniobacteraceae bacterium]